MTIFQFKFSLTESLPWREYESVDKINASRSTRQRGDDPEGFPIAKRYLAVVATLSSQKNMKDRLLRFSARRAPKRLLALLESPIPIWLQMCGRLGQRADSHA